jgi:hypothetical protein
LKIFERRQVELVINDNVLLVVYDVVFYVLLELREIGIVEHHCVLRNYDHLALGTGLNLVVLGLVLEHRGLEEDGPLLVESLNYLVPAVPIDPHLDLTLDQYNYPIHRLHLFINEFI